jgi:cystathionine beta-lyase
MPPKEFYPSLMNWIKDHHQWELKRSWIGFLPGIVPGLSFAVQSLTVPGDEVIVQPPVYYPFFHVVKNNNRVVINNPLKETNGRYEMDFDDLESKITPKTKMFILCNPHNPGGRVWKAETLKQLADICAKHNIIVVSDEIHADMVLGDHKHIPFATVSESAARISLTFMAPSKTFNMPGLISSSYIIPNEELRKQFVDFLEASELIGGNIFAYAATVAAYEKGEEWRKQMLDYVQGNIDYVVDFLKNNISQIKPMIPEASFLVWLNCEELGMNTDELFEFFAKKAGLGLNKGTTFGQGGEYHLRLNVACSRLILKKAMKQLSSAVNG